MTQKARRLISLIDPFALLGVRTDATALLCFAEVVYLVQIVLSTLIFIYFLYFPVYFRFLPSTLFLQAVHTKGGQNMKDKNNTNTQNPGQDEKNQKDNCNK